MENEKLQVKESDFRDGWKDDNGNSMAEILIALKCELDAKKQGKIHYMEDDCIKLVGKARKTFCNYFNQASSQVNVYLWKLSDPNDYLTFEAPSTLTITHMLTTCKGVFALDELLTPLVDGNEAFILALQEIRERSIELCTEEMDEDFWLKQKEFHAESKLPENELSVDEMVDEVLQIEQSQETFENMTIKEVLEFFQSFYCSSCSKSHDHYLIGTGKVVVKNREYDGIHVYWYPNIHDDYGPEMYSTSNFKKNKIRGMQFDQMRYIVGYINKFREVLKGC